MQRFTTRPLALVSSSATAGVFNPMTEAFNSRLFRDMRFRWWMASPIDDGGATKLTVRAGVQFSNQGATWTTPQEIGDFVDAAEDWTYGNGSYTDIMTTATTERLFVRFGMFAKSTGKTWPAQTKMLIEYKPVLGETYVFPRTRVNSKGSDTNWATTPISGWIPTELFGEYRATWELDAASDNFEAAIGYRTCDDRWDGTDWSALTAIGSSQTSEGLSYGTSFASLAPSARFIQFMGRMRNASMTTDIEAGFITLRVDARQT